MNIRLLAILVIGLTIQLNGSSFVCAHNNYRNTSYRTISGSEDTSDSIRTRELDEILFSIPPVKRGPNAYSLFQLPLVFRGFQNLREVNYNPCQIDFARLYHASDPCGPEEIYEYPDSLDTFNPYTISEENPMQKLLNEFELKSIDRDMVYRYMLENPRSISYALWKLPKPVKLKEDVYTRASFIKNQHMPEPDRNAAEITEFEIAKRHWLHKIEGGIQFSQAYLSSNWYQGGNNNLSLLVGFQWNVKLNEVYHPDLMLENNIQYKLGLFSTPQDKYHKYSVSEDIFQWNFKAGLRAFLKKWFYSVNIQFKTQLLNNYVQNEMTRVAAFLSPGDLNIGLGMTYNRVNKKKTFKFNASISPISYNLKTCICPQVDPVQFNIPVGKKTMSEIGSTGEITLEWALTSNIKYNSRLFLFSNYKYFLGDWENTLSFSINRFLSTQIYAHLRYDSSSEISDINSKWKHWMLKEILSFGFQYKFSTKI